MLAKLATGFPHRDGVRREKPQRARLAPPGVPQGSDVTTNEHRLALLDAACREMTVADIKKFTICIDPGYPAYVEQLTTVLRSKGRQGLDDVDWEPIFASTTDEPADDAALRRYRIFLAAIGCLHLESIDHNAIAITLVEEASRELHTARLSYDALEELARELSAFHDRDAAFVLLGCVLLAGSAAQDERALPPLVTRLRAEEARHHGNAKRKWRAAFLWSCTNARHTFPRWERCIERMLPSPSSLDGLRAELLGA
jgi:hypothetical protein